jgi:hypothetical protein
VCDNCNVSNFHNAKDLKKHWKDIKGTLAPKVVAKKVVKKVSKK